MRGLTLPSLDLDRIRAQDPCTASNAIERLIVRLRNEGFISGAVRCRFPNFEPMLGYAVTGRIRSSSPPMSGRCYYDRMDFWSYVATIPEPRVIVLQDVDHMPGVGAFVGEIHANIGLALDCIGYITNGAVRDLPAVKELGFHLFSGRVSVSHAYAHLIEFGEPVEIGGLKIATGRSAARRPAWHPDNSADDRIGNSAGSAAHFALGKRIDSVLQVAPVFAEGPFRSIEASVRGWPVRLRIAIPLLAGILVVAGLLSSCSSGEKASANAPLAAEGISVGVAKVGRKPLGRKLTVSSELVPFQEIDVYAKESGYVKKLDVDYGTRVKAGQVMAVLEIPELESQLQQDDASIKNAFDQITHAEHDLGRVQAQYNALHLQYDRLNGVAKSKPGLVAQQEVDDAQGKDLAAEAQVEASKSSLEATQSQLAVMQAKRRHDQDLYDYSKITAPFAGVVTQRFANLGALMQAGTSSSTQAMPLVRLSQDDLFRLVIPVPESYVRYIKIGDPVSVMVPSLNHTFPGKVARFSVDVKEDTRTMHTEVDVANPNKLLIPGLYAEATITLDQEVRRAGRTTAGSRPSRRQNCRRRSFSVRHDRGSPCDARHSDRHRGGSNLRIAGRRVGCGQRSERAEGRRGSTAQSDRIGRLPKPGRQAVRPGKPCRASPSAILTSSLSSAWRWL